MLSRQNPSFNSLSGISIPNSPEDMLRMFPALLSAFQSMQNRITELENKIKSLEVIGGNGNQM